MISRNRPAAASGFTWGYEDIRGEILFRRGVADYVKGRRWHLSQKLVERDNEDVVLSLTVNHLLKLRRWILSRGAAARVLEHLLAEDIRKTLFQTAKRYGT